MKKVLLSVAAFALFAGAMSAQSQFKAIAPFANKTNLVSLPTFKAEVGESPVFSARATRETRAGEQVSAKTLSNMNGIYREVAIPSLQGLSPAGTTIKVGTYYSPSLLARFHGNKITKINTTLGSNLKNITPMIVDAQSNKVVWTGKKLAPMYNTTSGKTKDVSFPCEFVIDQSKPFFVMYEATINKEDFSLSFVNNAVELGWVLDFGQGLMDASNVLGQPIAAYIDCVTEGPAGLKANDIELLSVTPSRALSGGKYQYAATFMNYGTNPVSSVESKNSVNKQVKADTLRAEGQGVPYMIPVQAMLEGDAPAEGSRYLQNFAFTKVNGVDDEFTATNVLTNKPDNELSTVLTVTETGYPRTIVMEEFTGMGCGWCPRGTVGMEKCEKALGDKFIGLAIHDGDPLASADYKPLVDLAKQQAGLPSAMINRIGMSFVDPYFGFEKDIVEDVKMLASAPVEAQTGLSSDWNEDETAVDVTAMFRFGLKGQGKHYSVAYALVEDGITGYPQYNFYHQAMGNIESIDKLPADLQFLFTKGQLQQTQQGQVAYFEPTFNNVACAIKDITGIAGSLDGLDISKGEIMTHTSSIKVPATVKNKKNLQVVFMLMDNLTGEIVNAIKTNIGDMVWDENAGVKEVVADAAEIAVVNGAVQVKSNGQVAIYSVDGKLVKSAAVNGEVTLSTFGLKGVHVVRVVNDGNITVKKVML